MRNLGVMLAGIVALATCACSLLFPLGDYGPGSSADAGSDAADASDGSCAYDAGVLDPALFNDAVEVTAGMTFACATVGGAVACWGNPGLVDVDGVLPSPPVDGVSAMLIRAGDGGVVSSIRHVAAGDHHVCAVDAAGGVWCWGRQLGGALGNGQVADAAISVPQAVLENGAPLGGVDSVACGSAFSCALTTSGAVKCWGDPSGGEFDASVPQGQAIDTGIGDATRLWAGGQGVCALRSNQLLWCWGTAPGVGAGSASPVIVPGINSLGAARDVMLNDRNACVLAADGTLHCAGNASWGSLGATLEALQGDAGQPSDTLAAVPEFAAGVAVSGAYDLTCVIGASGTVECLGENYAGQLGTGDTNSPPQPRPVVGDDGGPLTGVTAVASGNDPSGPRPRACALVKPTACAPQGRVLCWGDLCASGCAYSLSATAIKRPQ